MVRRGWELRSAIEPGLEGRARGQCWFVALCAHPSVFFAGRMLNQCSPQPLSCLVVQDRGHPGSGCLFSLKNMGFSSSGLLRRQQGVPEWMSRNSPSPVVGKPPANHPGTSPSCFSGYFGLLSPSSPYIPTHQGTVSFLHPRVTLLLPVPGVNSC